MVKQHQRSPAGPRALLRAGIRVAGIRPPALPSQLHVLGHGLAVRQNSVKQMSMNRARQNHHHNRPGDQANDAPKLHARKHANEGVILVMSKMQVPSALP